MSGEPVRGTLGGVSVVWIVGVILVLVIIIGVIGWIVTACRDQSPEKHSVSPEEPSCEPTPKPPPKPPACPTQPKPTPKPPKPKPTPKPKPPVKPCKPPTTTTSKPSTKPSTKPDKPKPSASHKKPATSSHNKTSKAPSANNNDIINDVETATEDGSHIGDGSGSVAPPRVSKSAKPIGQSYVVLLQGITDDAHHTAVMQDVADNLAATDMSDGSAPASIVHAYDTVYRGFSIENVNNIQLTQLRSHPNVKSIEPDIGVSHQTQTIPWGIARTGGTVSSTQSGNGSGAVSGVHIFIIDTGIAPHSDLNITAGATFVPGSLGPTDLNGHGTHVSGIAAAIDNTAFVVGESPGAVLHPVQVLDSTGSGQLSWVIAGVNYVAAWKQANPGVPCVANMSLGAYVGTTALNALDMAVEQAVLAGVIVCCAAGNSSTNAAYFSPAHANGVISVGSYNAANTFSSFSNFGSRVTFLAPGENVLSTWLDNSEAILSGTSMATPHVTGTIALYLSNNPTATPEQALLAAMDAASMAGQSKNPKILKAPYGTTDLSVWTGSF